MPSRRRLALPLVVVIASLLAGQSFGAIIRVKWDSPADGPGNDWDNAYHTIMAGMVAAASGDEVWVARGTYVENVTLKRGTALYGGFAGDEATRDQRDWKNRATVIDGNQAGNVVVAPEWATTSTRVDGFTIRNGKVHGKSPAGGGVYCQNSSPTIANNTITGNSVSCDSDGNPFGGGICCRNSSPVITNNTITDNSVTGWGSSVIYGGGICCSKQSSPTISNNTVVGNGRGGGIVCEYFSSPTITDNIISGNIGGGVQCSIVSSPVIANNRIKGNYGYRGGGVGCSNSSPMIVSNAITGNNGYVGGGIWCIYSQPTVSNNTIIDNSACSGGGICADQSSPAITNNIVAFNSSGVSGNSYGTPILRNNDVYGNSAYDYFLVSPGVDDFSADPQFASVKYGDVHLRPSSPCKDRGWNGAPGLPSVDIDGQPRTQGGTVEVGADESDGGEPNATPSVVVRVSPDGGDSNEGSSWVSAKRTIQAAIDAASATGGEVWVRAGVYNELVSLPPYVYMYGGFSGTEIRRSDRNWSANGSVIDGGGAGSVVNLVNGYLCGCVDGFLIRNGAAQDGGGIRCVFSSPIITNNTVTANRALSGGGGIYCALSSASITNNIITANSGYQGGGLYCSDSARITSNTIVQNKASQGGGIYFYSNQSFPATVSSNIIAFNSSGIHCGSKTGPVLRYNDVYGNAGKDYSGISAGVGDISLDPMFVNLAGGDFHIKANSPCVNAGWDGAAGIPTLDMDGEPRQNGIVDIGADEYWLGPVRCVSDAKSAIDTSPVSIYGGIVSAKFGDCFYVESDDRACGVLVKKQGHTLNAGDRARVLGALATNLDSERYIEATATDSTGTGSVGPLGMPNKSIGGGTCGLQSGVWGWLWTKDEFGNPVRVWDQVVGLNNIGLLISTCGKVTGIEHPDPPAPATWFTIDDGSDLNLKCIVPSGVTIEPGWQYVRVTGVASCEKVGSELHAVVKVRSREDVAAL